MTWLLARLAEPSTWAGLGLIVTGIGPAIQNKDPTTLLQGLAQVIGGAAAVVVPEGSTKPKA